MKQNKHLSGTFAYDTNVGRVRLSNDDRANAIVNSKGYVLLIVCDGMGGQNKGDLASTLAIDFVSEEFKNRKMGFLTKANAIYWLNNTIRKANMLVYNESNKNPDYAGMGTTLTAVLIAGNYIIVAQVGDSRAYELRNDEMIQLNEDQTYVAYLYRTGQIQKEEMKTHPKRHVLMNALGIYPSLEIDTRIFPYNGQRLLLCSDGLYNNVRHNDILNVLKGNDAVEQKVNELIQIANANGGSDNIAVVIWEANE